MAWAWLCSRRRPKAPINSNLADCNPADSPEIDVTFLDYRNKALTDSERVGHPGIASALTEAVDMPPELGSARCRSKSRTCRQYEPERQASSRLIRTMEQLFSLCPEILKFVNHRPIEKGPAARLPDPFYFLWVFSDDQASSRNHDPCDEGGLTREQQRFGEDSGHVAPRM
jgi:hypothetical protein